MAVNRTTDSAWATEGQYVLFADRLDDPDAWSKPVKFIDPKTSGTRGWYVQVVGTSKGETDKLASRTARLFIDGQSKWGIHFKRAGE